MKIYKIVCQQKLRHVFLQTRLATHRKFAFPTRGFFTEKDDTKLKHAPKIQNEGVDGVTFVKNSNGFPESRATEIGRNTQTNHNEMPLEYESCLEVRLSYKCVLKVIPQHRSTYCYSGPGPVKRTPMVYEGIAENSGHEPT